VTKQEQLKGFTLLELLIVIAILSILAMALILVLNPAETMKKSRDTQRMTDLSTLKTALGLYTTNVNPVDLDGSGTGCLGSVSGTPVTNAKIFYSVTSAIGACAAEPTPGLGAIGTFDTTDWCEESATPADASGTGWIPVNFSGIPGGSPISNLPLDPTNTVGTATQPASTDFVYRYACQAIGDATHPSTVFEVDAVLESDAFTSTDNKMTKDGGDNADYYEVGTSLKILPTGLTF